MAAQAKHSYMPGSEGDHAHVSSIMAMSLAIHHFVTTTDPCGTENQG